MSSLTSSSTAMLDDPRRDGVTEAAAAESEGDARPSDSSSPSLEERAAIFRDAAIERLTTPDELDELMVVTRPRSWLVLAAVALLVGAAVGWAVLGRVAVTAPAEGVLVALDDGAAEQAGPLVEEGAEDATERLGALLFLPISRAHEVRPGLEVHLSPRGYPATRHGLLEGRVVRVGERPVLAADLRRELGELGWIEELGDGVHVRVEVELVPDPDAPSGYRWTSRAEPAGELIPRVAVDATLHLRSEAPILHALPWLRATGD